jgi:hypothetical protein
MVGMIVSMLGGVLTTVIAMLIGVDGSASIWIGVAAGIVILAALFALTASAIVREQGKVPVAFPTPASTSDPTLQPES